VTQAGQQPISTSKDKERQQLLLLEMKLTNSPVHLHGLFLAFKKSKRDRICTVFVVQAKLHNLI